jgi:hypothetical protein
VNAVHPFLHDRIQKFGQLLEGSSSALSAYSAFDPGLGRIAAAFLGQAGAVYRALNLGEVENDLLGLAAQLTSAHSGVHPVTFERVTRHRREMERSVALQVLLSSAGRIRADHSEARDALDQARQRLVPILSYGIEAGLVKPPANGTYTQPELTDMWASLRADSQLQAATRQIAMTMAMVDVYLLLPDLLAAAEH